MEFQLQISKFGVLECNSSYFVCPRGSKGSGERGYHTFFLLNFIIILLNFLFFENIAKYFLQKKFSKKFQFFAFFSQKSQFVTEINSFRIQPGMFEGIESVNTMTLSISAVQDHYFKTFGWLTTINQPKCTSEARISSQNDRKKLKFFARFFLQYC